MFDAMQAQYGIQAVTFTLLWQAKVQYIRAPHRPVYEAIAEGLGADERGRASEEQVVLRYEQGVALLPKALEEAPALLDNYVLNEMLRECFPFGSGGGNPLEQFLRLVTRFGLVRFMLAVQCSADRPLPSPQMLASTVQVFARRFQHDKAFAAQVDSCFANAGWNQLDKIFKLLKA
jgi:lysine-N-methylase